MQKVFQSQINTVLVIAIVLLAIVAGAAGGVLLAGDTVYDYTLMVNTGGPNGEPIQLQYGTWPELADIGFFRTVRDGFIAEKANFVEANLTAMSLVVYHDGVPVVTVPIKSKGKEGSWWETPSGLYRAQAKEAVHFSSFGHVYLPWSIPFQGNFFIHGWPYHEDGTPVPEGYSGGCMRLEDQYAKQVYDAIAVGMPILVFEEAQFTAATSPYALNVPHVSAQSYLVADLDSNFVLLAGASDVVRDTATIGLLMTALVASEHQNIEKLITIPYDMSTGPLRAGASYRLYDLLFPLLVSGDTEVIPIVANNVGAARFSALMQAKIAALGMQHTTVSSQRADRDLTTTAEDAFILLKYLHTNRPFILGMSAGTIDVVTYGAPVLQARSNHPFVGDTRFLGGVMGGASLASPPETTAAVALVFATSTPVTARTGTSDLLSVFSIPFDGTTRTVGFVVLDSENPGADTRAMWDFVQRMYR